MYIENSLLKKNISLWLILMFWMIFIMIIVGGLTRLTDSGLSITQWELFSGLLPPFTNSDWEFYFSLYREIPEFKIQNYSMTLNEFKVIFWWEWSHRFLGRLIGIFFLLPLIFFTIKLGFKKLSSLYLIFFLIALQGFIGWYMVSSGLVDRVDVSHYRLALHLLIAFIILSLIFWNYLKLKNIKINGKCLKLIFPIFFLIFVFVQISLGAFVSGMDAGKIYNSWPLMGSSYFPDDNNFINLFNLSAFDDPSLVQFMHRNMAYIIIIYYLIILFQVYRNNLTSFFQTTILIGIILFIQTLLGILTLLYGAQILLASMHQISSIILVTLSIYLLYLATISSSN